MPETPETEMVVCDVTGKVVPASETIFLDGKRVCAEGKVIMLERLRSGGDTRPVSGSAIAVLVLGILSILLACCCWGILSFVLGGLAIGLSFPARTAHRAGHAGAGMTKAGLICGIIGVSLSLLFVILLIIGLAVSPNSVFK